MNINLESKCNHSIVIRKDAEHKWFMRYCNRCEELVLDSVIVTRDEGRKSTRRHIVSESHTPDLIKPKIRCV